MRTTLFLSTLFALSLAGSAALAEKPAHDKPIREPRAIQTLRIHGDTVDKSYAHADKASRASNSASAVREVKSPLKDPGASRMNCSDTGADCSKGAHAAAPKAAPQGARAGGEHGSVRSPLHERADARVNCNEADECSASSRASQPKWTGHGTGGQLGKDATVLTARDAQPRLMGQAGSDRMACNEADECMMSSKAAKKIWAIESVKAGTMHHSEADEQKQKDQKKH
ncbi:MAG: hypothetical protein U0359_00425 [Byssovorax sp.]